MTKLLPLLLIALLAMTPAAYSGEFKPYKGQTTPSLSLKDLAGTQHDLGDYKGKVVLVQFWATYCPPCRKEMPSMNRLMKKMGDNFAILAIDMGETQQQVQAFVDDVKPEFTILLDENGRSTGEWKVFAAPSSFIIDPDGQARFTLFGGIEWDSDEVVSRLQSLL